MRYSLRTLLIVVTLFCLILPFCEWEYRNSYHEMHGWLFVKVFDTLFFGVAWPSEGFDDIYGPSMFAGTPKKHYEVFWKPEENRFALYFFPK